MNEAAGEGMTLRTQLILGRISNLPTVWTNCLAGWVLGGGEISEVTVVVALAAAASLFYVGGMMLNDACDAEFDSKHNPTRPIPSGQVSRQEVTILGIGYLSAGLLVFLATTGASVWWILGLLFSILIYDLAHKKWEGSVWVMGACRFFLYLVGASASGGGGEVVYLSALGILFYIAGVTLVARGESTGENPPWWPWMLLLAPAVVWALPGWGWKSAVFLLIFLGWLAASLGRLRAGGERRIGRFVSWLLAGIVLADALLISPINPAAAWICVMFLPVTLLLQKKVPAT